MFHFPEPGELHNPSGIPLSDEDAYWLLLVSGKTLAWQDNDAPGDETLNPVLLAWWNLMNALPRDQAILCQKLIRAACGGRLPDAPWEEVAPDGTPLT